MGTPGRTLQKPLEGQNRTLEGVVRTSPLRGIDQNILRTWKPYWAQRLLKIKHLLESSPPNPEAQFVDWPHRLRRRASSTAVLLLLLSLSL